MMDVFVKFNNCRYNDGGVCILHNHLVGINGYSVKFHCGWCDDWEERRE